MSNVIDNSVENITNLIENVFDKMMEASDLLVGVSTTIAGIGCLIYIATILLPMIERTEKFQLYPLLKPIFVAIVITNFPILTKAVSDVGTGLGSALSEMVTSSNTADYFTLFQEKVDQMLEVENSPTPPSSTFEGGSPSNTHSGSGNIQSNQNLQNSTDPVSDDGFWGWLVWQVIYKLLIPALAWLAMFLGQIFYIGILLFSKFYLVVLALVGPLSFALSQFKMFAGSAPQWLARFISVALWPGLAALVRGVIDQIVKAIASNLVPTLSGVLVSIILLLFSATLYLHVPTLADFVVRSGGVGNTTGAAKSALRKVFRR